MTARNSAGSAPATSARVGPVQPARPTAAQIETSLLKQINPFGRSARIAALAKAGKYTYSLQALIAGKAQIYWYYLPPGAHLAATKPKPVLVASGHLTFSVASTGKLTVKTTPAGRTLLKHEVSKNANHLELTGRASFTPVGTATVTARKTFMLEP